MLYGYTVPPKFVKLKTPLMTTWGHNYEICKNTLLWNMGLSNFHDSEQNVREACRIMHKKSWRWAIDKGKPVTEHPQVKQLFNETGLVLYNGLYTCLYASFHKKIHRKSMSICTFCPVPEMCCDGNGMMSKYRYHPKYALVIANAWKE